MQYKLIETGEVLEATNYTEMVRKIGKLKATDDVNAYMKQFSHRFVISYGIRLFYATPKAFIESIITSGKFMCMV